MRFLVFLLTLVVGIPLIVYSRALVDFTGRVGWAERNLGGGGTYTLMKLIGVGVIVIGMMYLTGTFDTLFGDTAGGSFENLETDKTPD